MISTAPSTSLLRVFCRFPRSSKSSGQLAEALAQQFEQDVFLVLEVFVDRRWAVFNALRHFADSDRLPSLLPGDLPCCSEDALSYFLFFSFTSLFYAHLFIAVPQSNIVR